MEQPYISTIPSKTLSATRFGGINLSDGTPLGEWEQLSGMDFSAYPALKTCAPLCREPLPEGITGYTFRGGELVYTVSDGIFAGGVKTDLSLSDGEKTLVNIGAYIVILPDMITVNTAANPITAEYASADKALCGTVTERNFNQLKPVVKLKKDWYITVDYGTDTTVSEIVSAYRKGDTKYLTWTDSNGKKQTRCVKIKSVSIMADESGGLCFRISFDAEQLDLDYFYTQEREAADGETTVQIANVTICDAVIPEMDFVTEHGNRLWGCSSKNHEIYCSALGRPLVWGEYAGLSTDSWAATTGTDGDFTGIAVYGDSVLFFKENCVHIVYGTKASNFTVGTIQLRGVQKGSHGSICRSNGLLYYKAPEGIFAFNGSTSVKTDARLGADITDAMTGAADDRFIVMITSGGTAYFYDCVHDCRYTRALENVISAHSINGKLYAVTRDSGGSMARVQLTGERDNPLYDGETRFCAVSGCIGRGEVFGYIKKLRMSIEALYAYPLTAVSFKIGISCDGGEWQDVFVYDGENTAADGKTLVLAPIIPLRCHSVKLKLSGTLKNSPKAAIPSLTLYGIYIDKEEGSEIGGKH